MYFARGCSFPEGALISVIAIHSRRILGIRSTPAGGFHVSAIRQGPDLVEVVRDRLDLRARHGGYN